MNNLTGLIEKYFVPMAGKLSKNKFLKAISNGFSVLLPITMIGAIFTLLANLQIAPYQSFVKAVHLKEIFGFAPKVTTDMLAVYAVFLIGKALAEQFDFDDNVSTIVGALSLFSFLVLIPLGVSGKAEKSQEIVSIAGAMPTTYLGAAGLFTAMIVGLLVPFIYQTFIKHNIVLKMPEQVPPTIAKSFSALIPAFSIAFIFGLIRFLFSLTPFGDANSFIYTVMKAPLSNLGASPATFILFILVCSLMWFFGLHGGMIVMPFINVLYTAAGLENLEAYANGVAGPNLITNASWLIFASVGGAGGTLGLCIIMAFMAKSSRYKTLGKLALPAGACGINEPITFGLPMVLNTIMIIPLIITPITTFLISYFMMRIGIIPPLNGTTIPLGTPVVFAGLVAGGWKTAVLQIVLIAVQILIYLPFFKVLDKQAVLEEKGTA
ncbi:permease IIC component [Lacrimispora amygdalina]|uniref:Permease IIC component n=1 Tax=Lacrimispora amygdalina TaxID=253257 RepID=A0A3E2N7N4_9FIRM|nr:PTS transporter subunit EIIC [Clostridium indicum]RFZ77005.1 PTS sugar transporter subunit IIC [Clostridium indicum]